MKKIKVFLVIAAIFTITAAYAEDEAYYNKNQSPNVLFNITADDISPYWGLNARYSFSDSETYLGGQGLAFS